MFKQNRIQELEAQIGRFRDLTTSSAELLFLFAPDGDISSDVTTISETQYTPISSSDLSIGHSWTAQNDDHTFFSAGNSYSSHLNSSSAYEYSILNPGYQNAESKPSHYDPGLWEDVRHPHHSRCLASPLPLYLTRTSRRRKRSDFIIL